MPLPEEVIAALAPLVAIFHREVRDGMPDDHLVGHSLACDWEGALDGSEVRITAGDCRLALRCMEGPHVLEVDDEHGWQVAHPLRCSVDGEGGILACVVHRALDQSPIAASVAPGRYSVDLAGNDDDGWKLVLDPLDASPLYVPPKKGGKSGLLLPPGRN